MTLGRAEMTDGKAQRETVVQSRVRKKHLAGRVDALEQRLIEHVELCFAHGPVARPCAETDDAERHGREALKVEVPIHPLTEQLRETDVLGDRISKPVRSKMTKNHPKFQRSEPPAELDARI